MQSYYGSKPQLGVELEDCGGRVIRFVSDMNIVLDDPSAHQVEEIADNSRLTQMSEEDHEGDNDGSQAADLIDS